MKEKEKDKEEAFNWHDARATAYEEAAAFVLNEAAACWLSSGQDDIAVHFRVLGRALKNKADEERRKQVETGHIKL